MSQSAADHYNDIYITAQFFQVTHSAVFNCSFFIMTHTSAKHEFVHLA